MRLARKFHEDNRLLLKALDSFSDFRLISSLMLGVAVVVVVTFLVQRKALLKLKVAPLIRVPGSSTAKIRVACLNCTGVKEETGIYM